jgi:phenylalanyl-tRNA synthetase beta chain
MLISWDWLSDYVKLDKPIDEVVTRWAMSGLNHESTQMVEGVPVIDLEVTSNRADCLGHIGVAREAAVLHELPLVIPQPQPPTVAQDVASLLTVENQFREGCPRYTARVIRGVKVGPSPEWLAKRLRAIGINPINNVVDATNYVMMECGQPLHAFDLSRIRGNKIVIRPGQVQESFVAIDHRAYTLDPQMIVIADSERAVALGGVMGGLDSEVSPETRDVMIEAASFVPMAIRRTARKLKLHSPSSHRFERRIDPDQLDWASRRCCELILQMAGGELLAGCIESVAEAPDGAAPIPGTVSLDAVNVETNRCTEVTLRRSQIVRVLGIEIPWDKSQSILERLGCGVSGTGVDGECRVVPPSFRQDLSREVDLIEEVARIYGYEQIPEDAMVPMVASSKRPKDIVMTTVRGIACAAGFDETLNPSLIGKSATDRISPWSSENALATMMPLLEGASSLRRSLLPSLIAARLHNQSQSNRDVRLFETASIYLPQGAGLPIEQLVLGLIAESDIRLVRGVFEEILERTCGLTLEGATGCGWNQSLVDWDFLDTGSGVCWMLGDAMLAWVGALSKSLAQSIKLEGAVAIGELNLSLLLERARLVPQVRSVVPYPAIVRDLNFVVDESVQWQSMREVIAAAAGDLCVALDFREIYRDAKRDGVGKKRMLLALTLQSRTDTLRSEQADQVIERVLDTCRDRLAAELLAS